MTLEKLNGILNLRNECKHFDCLHCEHIQYCEIIDNYDLDLSNFENTIKQIEEIYEEDY